MKILFRLRAILVSLAIALTATFAPSSAHAQAGTGNVEGRVQNVATGQFLSNARIAVQSADLVAFTDESGTYRLARVPSGSAVLEVFYTGLDAQQIALNVVAGQTTRRDVELASAALYVASTGPVQLDAFTVSTARETNVAAIAVNEQRFAPNIKNVVSADSLGDVMDGNVGEFLKFMPGVTAESDREGGGAVSSVPVRGFPTSMAVVSSDGVQMANTGVPNGTSRTFQFHQVSLNNISRLEVTKVPVPSSPADSMAGSVNMVTKSSFERNDALLRFSVGLSANSEALDLKKTTHVSDEKIWKIRPSASFDYTLPVTKNFGLVLTASSVNRYVDQAWLRKTYNATSANTDAAFAPVPPGHPVCDRAADQRAQFSRAARGLAGDAERRVIVQSRAGGGSSPIAPPSTIPSTLAPIPRRRLRPACAWVAYARTYGRPNFTNIVPSTEGYIGPRLRRYSRRSRRRFHGRHAEGGAHGDMRARPAWHRCDLPHDDDRLTRTDLRDARVMPILAAKPRQRGRRPNRRRAFPVSFLTPPSSL